MMTSDLIHWIRELYKELREIELVMGESHKTSPLDFTKSFEILKKIELLSDQSKEARKILQIKSHLNIKMTAQSLACQIVPLERILAKDLEDSDILITSSDLTEPVSPKIPLLIALDNIRSRFNIGSIFRVADCIGVEKIYLCGYSAPPNQFKSLNDKNILEKKSLSKTSMGTDQYVHWESCDNIRTLIPNLKAQGIKCIAFETTSNAINLYEKFHSKIDATMNGAMDATLPLKTVFIFGNERFGLDLDVLKLVDEVRKIPLHGYKNSLNVAAAVAISAFEWRRQYEQRS